MKSKDTIEWLNSIVRRHKQSRKIQRTLPAAKIKPPVSGGTGVADSPTIDAGT